MSALLFGSDLWKPALDRYAEAAGLTVDIFGVDGQVVLGSQHPTPLVALFRQHGVEPGLFAECARRCLNQTEPRPAVVVSEPHGLSVVGTSLILDGAVVGAAVAGYALAEFLHVAVAQRWARSAGLPFDRLWEILRRQSPVPERRLLLHGELLQVLGDALLRENFRTRQYEDAVVQLRAAAAAKDEFLAVLSHELRTPLAAIFGWAGVLRKSDSPDQIRKAGEIIERNVLIQSRMVEDLLDVNRISHGALRLDFDAIDVAVGVRAALETAVHSLEQKRMDVEFSDADTSLYVRGDAGRLQQIIRNVFTNAVKFTPAGGRIRVSIRRDADHALIVVADTGVGIAPEFMPHVFDIFRQQEQGTRREHEGLGIGLALVKRLTELHNGTVSIVSAGVGCGTEVSVRLPLLAEVPALCEAPSAGAAKPGSTLTGLSVLLVEDSEDARESLRLLLKLLGAEVGVARDGCEALELIGQVPFDVVLCDLRMPRMDGYEFIRELHGRSPLAELPVVAMSGLASAQDRQRTREAGFDAHLMKPFDTASMVAAVDGAVTRRNERRTAAG